MPKMVKPAKPAKAPRIISCEELQGGIGVCFTYTNGTEVMVHVHESDPWLLVVRVIGKAITLEPMDNGTVYVGVVER